MSKNSSMTMAMAQTQAPHHWRGTEQEAVKLCAELNADEFNEPDRWQYRAIRVPGGEMIIRIYDERGDYLGTL